MAARAHRMPRGAQSHRAHRLDRGEHQSRPQQRYPGGYCL